MTERPDTTSDCPQREDHTPAPTGYVDWFAWAGKKARTHRQVRHEACGRFTVWVPRR